MTETTSEEMIAEAKKTSDKVTKLRKTKLKIEKKIERINKKWRRIRIIEEIQRLINTLNLSDPLPDVLRFNAIEIYITANANIDGLQNRNVESIAAACLILSCEKAFADISFSDINKNSPERGCVIGGVYGLIKYKRYDKHYY